MLVKEDFKQAILTMIQNLSESDRVDSVKVHDEYALVIETYVKENLEVTGTYNGTTPSSNPDPNNGSYTWHLNVLNISGEDLRNGAYSQPLVFEGYCRALELEFQEGEFTGGDISTVINISECKLIQLSLAHLYIGLDGSDNTADAIDYFVEKLIEGLVGVSPDPSSVSATSPAGSGTVSFGVTS